MKVTMDDQAREHIRAALAKRVTEATKHPDRALERLVQEGFYTPRGQLTPQFGGRKVAAS